MAETLTIIHSADWHLSSRLSAAPYALRRAVEAAQERMLHRLAGLCRERGADVLLLAGDIFDSARPEARWLSLFQEFLAGLGDCRVYIAAGNHDPCFADGFWTETRWPDRVRVFGPQAECCLLEKAGISLAVCGRSFAGLAAEAPLWDGGTPPEAASADCALLLLHGELLQEGAESHYNPIYWRSETYAHFDYLACGHVHQARSLAGAGGPDFACYPGIPQGRGYDECGVGTVNLLRLERRGGGLQRELRREPVSDLRFMQLSCRTRGEETREALAEAIWAQLLEQGKIAPEDRTALARLAVRVELQGARPAELVLSEDYLSERFRERGLCDLRLHDRSHPARDLAALERGRGLSAQIYRCYLAAPGRGGPADEADEAGRLARKALEYALDAHDGRLDPDACIAALEAYRRYREEWDAR